MAGLDLLHVRTPLVTFHVLRDEGGLYLIDTGFLGGRRALARALQRHGWEREPLRGIILTHGHLDHVFNAAAIARETGAWIAAPRLDARHYMGKPGYCGWSRVAGMLEAAGRRLPGFGPFTPDRWIGDGDVLDVWGGLRAIHLPGHTAGHTGFYCEHRRWLFSADLFASFRGFAHFPPRFFNSDPQAHPASVEKALSLDLEGVIPNHGDAAAPSVHLERLRRLVRR